MQGDEEYDIIHEEVNRDAVNTPKESAAAGNEKPKFSHAKLELMDRRESAETDIRVLFYGEDAQTAREDISEPVIEESDAFEKNFLSGLLDDTGNGSAREEDGLESTDAATESSADNDRLALLGKTLLEAGGMPTAEQLAAMGLDEPTARGIQPVIWLSKEGDPEARRAVEAMADLTDPQSWIELQETAAAKIPAVKSVLDNTVFDTLGGIDSMDKLAGIGMVDADGVIDGSQLKIGVAPYKVNQASTLKDWEHDISLLSEQAPIEVPKSAQVTLRTKTGYEQISFTWANECLKYEVRWHTKTPGAPEGQGNTLVVSRITPGTPTGKRKTEHILVGNQWIARKQWQEAISAYREGTATPE